MDAHAYYSQNPSEHSALADLLQSVIGAFLQRAMMAPSYRLTVLTAVEGELVRSGRLPKEGFGGVWGCVRRIYRKEGPRAFFRGLVADAVLAIPSALAEEFSSMAVSILVESLVPLDLVQSMPPGAYVTISLGSTALAVLLATPLTGWHNTIVTNYVADIIAPDGDTSSPNETSTSQDKTSTKAKANAESYKYTTAREAAWDIRQRWGWRGFYSGVGLDAMAVFLYRGTYYYTLQLLPAAVHDRYPYTIARGLAIVAGCLTQPFEVISRRMLLAASTGKRYGSMRECYRTIVEEEGYTALWSGLRARLLITCIGMAVVEMRRFF